MKEQTMIPLFSGGSKAIEYLVVGDNIIGVSGKPTKVLEIKKKECKLYELKTEYSDEPQYLSGDHVLSFYTPKTNGYTITDMEVEEYLSKSRIYTAEMRLYKMGYSVPTMFTLEKTDERGFCYELKLEGQQRFCDENYIIHRGIE